MKRKGILDNLLDILLGEKDDTVPKQKEPVPETPEMQRWKAIKTRIDEIVTHHYPGASWRFISEDQASILSDRKIAKQVVIQTTSGAMEHRILCFETVQHQTESGILMERTVYLKPTATDMEKRALKELARNRSTAPEGQTVLWSEVREGEMEAEPVAAAPVVPNETPVAAIDEPEDDDDEDDDDEELVNEAFSTDQWFDQNAKMLALLQKTNASGRFIIPKQFYPDDPECIAQLKAAFEAKGKKASEVSMGLEIA